ncbi:hypothetical protein ACFQ22_07375 [Lentilactobacillus raoultii]|uniref:Uncharacterized protein n=1 Tax=Lentilactobacillus raoultii TaxID=1987503 RepID=A0ABW3PHX3_9LACO|nr:hypothetical protein [Lentilactobacillus raoultii]
MAKLRPSLPDFSFTTMADYRRRLEQTVRWALPIGVNLVARNFARSTASSYWLLQKQSNWGIQWLTLRIATHPVWLKQAQQLEILWSNPRDFDLLGRLLKTHLMQTEMQPFYFQMSVVDLSTLKLLVELEHHQLIWFIKLTSKIAQAHKQQRFDLITDFPKATLLLGDRNNANHLLRRIDHPKFQHQLALFYGQNLLFSQFTKHQLLKLLPTNQWLQPIVGAEGVPRDWQSQLKEIYGNEFVTVCFTEMKNQICRLT